VSVRGRRDDKLVLAEPQDDLIARADFLGVFGGDDAPPSLRLPQGFGRNVTGVEVSGRKRRNTRSGRPQVCKDIALPTADPADTRPRVILEGQLSRGKGPDLPAPRLRYQDRVAATLERDHIAVGHPGQPIG